MFQFLLFLSLQIFSWKETKTKILFCTEKMSVFRNLIKFHRLHTINSIKLPPNCIIQSRDTIFNDKCTKSFHTTSSLCSVTPSPSCLEHIYTGSLTDKMKAVKLFSLTTSAAGLAIQPILVEQGAKLGGTPMVVFLCSFAGFFTFITPVLLHFVAKKYVTKMHFNSVTDEYVATTISFFMRQKDVSRLFVLIL